MGRSNRCCAGPGPRSPRMAAAARREPLALSGTRTCRTPARPSASSRLLQETQRWLVHFEIGLATYTLVCCVLKALLAQNKVVRSNAEL